MTKVCDFAEIKISKRMTFPNDEIAGSDFRPIT